jgi:Rrf2 family protein
MPLKRATESLSLYEAHIDKEDLQSLYYFYGMKRSKSIERSSLMNVGRRVDYAVRALSFLAGQPAGNIVSRADIEKSQDIPSFYLSKIMKDLVAGGLVRSHIGSKGGFSLAKVATSITIKDVYETVERPLVLMDCLQRGAAYCSYCSVCTQRSIWEEAQKVLSEFLGRISIGEIADRDGLKGRLQKTG